MAELKLEEFFPGSNMEDFNSTDPELLDIFSLGNPTFPVAPSVKEMPANLFQRQVDQQLIQATMTVLRTGKLTPLIKEELKCTIQNRRLARGEDELTVDMSPPPTSHRLSTEEEADVEQKRRIRREKNRISAQKSRRKRKAQEDGTMQQVKQLEMKNLALQTEFDNLSREKAIILKALGDLSQRQHQQQPTSTVQYYSPI